MKRNIENSTRLLTAITMAAAMLMACRADVSHQSKETESATCDRIVSLAPSLTETAFALDMGDRLVGVTRFCDYPPEAKSKKVVGGYVDPNYEVLSALKPDMALLLEHHAPVQKRLDALGIKSHVMTSESIEGLTNSIRSLGIACGVQQRAEALASSMEKRIEAVKAKTSGRNRPKVLMSVGRSMGSESITDIYAAGKGSLFDELITAAGGENAFKGNMGGYARMSIEGVLELNPDVIVDLIVDLDMKGIAEEDVVKQWNVAARTSAVAKGRVHVLSSDYVVIPGPRIVLLVEELMGLFHPELKSK